MTRLIRAVAYAVAFAVQTVHLVDAPRTRQQPDGSWANEEIDVSGIASRSLRVAELAVQWWRER